MGVHFNLVFVVSNLCLLPMFFHCRCLHADQLPKDSPLEETEGSISIACGASEDIENKLPEFVYKSDKDMIESGISKQISRELQDNWAPQYWSLRSFPNGKRNCYLLKPEEEEEETNMSSSGNSKKYLVRASFVYGNYDGLNTTPIFDLHLGVNYWTTVDQSSETRNAITRPINNYIEVCLVNTANGVPYISTLELRPLDISLYSTDPTDRSKPLQLLALWDLGGNQFKVIRYPEDVYDRYWYGWGCERINYKNDTKLVWTNMSISESNDDPNNNVPDEVLQTTCRTNNSKFPLEIYWTTPKDEGSNRYYFCFHFAEIEKLPSGEFREMSIILNDIHIITPSIKLLQYLTPQTLCSKSYYVFTDQTNKFSIYSVNSSSPFPPSLNAIQIFRATDTSSNNSPTFFQDVNAIREIKQHYKLRRNWEGDPCQPSEFSWDGLNCTNNNINNDYHSFSPRITLLDLSKSNLTGDIASSISLLTAIKYLDLSDNELEGEIPEFLALLPQLQLLNLSGNKLRGVVPYTLLQKSKDGTFVLSVEGNGEVCLSSPCNEKKKNEFRIPVPIFGCLIAAIVLLLIIIIVLVTLIIVKKK